MSALQRFVATVLMTGLLLASTPALSGAAPAPVKESFRVKNDLVVFPIESEQACVLGAGRVTSYETGVGHLSAAGVEVGEPSDPDDDVLIAPAKLDLNIKSKVTFSPDDPSLPTYHGNSHMHFAWKIGASGTGPARVERTIVLKAIDGSRYFLHHVGRAIFDLSQIDSPNEGLVEITSEKITCSR